MNVNTESCESIRCQGPDTARVIRRQFGCKTLTTILVNNMMVVIVDRVTKIVDPTLSTTLLMCGYGVYCFGSLELPW